MNNRQNPSLPTPPVISALRARPDTRNQSATVMPGVCSPFVSISTLMWRP